MFNPGIRTEEFHDTNLDHRDGFGCSPVFFAGIRSGAKPRYGIDS
jgi:hypothetical protein